MNAMEKMAYRDLRAAADAVAAGRKLTALSLALDAVCSIGGGAAEGAAFVPQPDEVNHKGELPDLRDQVAAVVEEAGNAIQALPTLWTSVKHYRDDRGRRDEKPPVQIL